MVVGRLVTDGILSPSLIQSSCKHLSLAIGLSMVHVSSNTKTTQVPDTTDMGLGYSTTKCHVLCQYLYFPSQRHPLGHAPVDWEKSVLDPLQRYVSHSKQTSEIVKEGASARALVPHCQRNTSKEDRHAVHYSPSPQFQLHKVSKVSMI